MQAGRPRAEQKGCNNVTEYTYDEDDLEFPIADDPEKLLEVDDRKPFPLPIPEWQMTVLILPLTGVEAAKFRARYRRFDDSGNLKMSPKMQADFVSRVVVHPDGSRLFTQQHVERLAKRSVTALDRIERAANRGEREKEGAFEEDFDDRAEADGSPSSIDSLSA